MGPAEDTAVEMRALASQGYGRRLGSNANDLGITPLGDRVVIRPDPTEHVTPGGLVVPDIAKSRGRGAVVVAVGPGRITDRGVRIAPGVQIGDRVLMHLHKGLEIEHGGEKLLVLAESDLMCIIG